VRWQVKETSKRFNGVNGETGIRGTKSPNSWKKKKKEIPPDRQEDRGPRRDPFKRPGITRATSTRKGGCTHRREGVEALSKLANNGKGKLGKQISRKNMTRKRSKKYIGGMENRGQRRGNPTQKTSYLNTGTRSDGDHLRLK